jgi:hypothetical protein
MAKAIDKFWFFKIRRASKSLRRIGTTTLNDKTWYNPIERETIEIPLSYKRQKAGFVTGCLVEKFNFNFPFGGLNGHHFGLFRDLNPAPEDINQTKASAPFYHYTNLRS